MNDKLPSETGVEQSMSNDGALVDDKGSRGDLGVTGPRTSSSTTIFIWSCKCFENKGAFGHLTAIVAIINIPVSKKTSAKIR
jgi:hypothetical protein